jgi:exopolysaccharide biosynthesis polyprenyl glycosylphosphotransferase
VDTRTVVEIPNTQVNESFLPSNGSPSSPLRRVAPRRRRQLAWLLIDVLLVCISGALAYAIRFSPILSQHLASLERPLEYSAPHGYSGFLLLYVVLLVLVAYAQKLYRFSPSRSPLTESLLTGQTVMIATLILMAFIYLSGIKTISRLVVGLTAIFTMVFLSAWRACRWYIAKKYVTKGNGLQHVLIVGAGKVGKILADYLEKNPSWGYSVRGFLDGNHNGDPRILGKIEDLPRLVRQEFIDEIFIAIPSERELVKSIALEARKLCLGVKVIPELYDGLAWLSPVEFIGDLPVMILHREPIPAFGLFVKRSIDIVGSLLGLILISPILALIAIAIQLDSAGPIFYCAHRVGKKGRKFVCYKFRTMIPNADELKDKLRSLNERQGPFFKIACDPRVTRVGAFLRRYSLDELPQLWNVLKGEMSMVGPRPHPIDDFKQYTLEHLRRLDVTPGVTCLWQISARHDPSFETALALDNYYIENWSLLLDLKILFKTMFVVLKGRGC